MLCRVVLSGFPLRHGPAGGQIAVDQIVSRSLVCHKVRTHTTRLGTAYQLGQYFCRIAEQGNRHGLFCSHVLRQHGKGLVDIFGLLVHIARAQTEIDTALLAFDVEGARSGQSGGQGLCAAHAAQTCSQNPAACPVVVVMLTTGFHKSFKRTLHDALCADVNPRACRHLPIHEQTLAVEFVEVLPVGPLRNQVGVGDQHTRCVGVCLENPHRLA